MRRPVWPLHARHPAARSVPCFPQAGQEIAIHADLPVHQAHELAQDSQLGVYLPVIHLTTLSAASDPATRDKHPGASACAALRRKRASRRFAPRAASGVSALRVTIAVPALLRALTLEGICWHSRWRLPSA